MNVGPNAPAVPEALDLSGSAQWLAQRGLRGLPLEEQVDGFCRRMVDAGLPARRFNMAIGTLHPRLGGRSYVWRPSGLETEEFVRPRSDEDRDPYLRSPIHYMQSRGESRLRCRLDAATPYTFPVLADLREAGMTDYVAWVVAFDDAQAAQSKSGESVDVVAQPNPMQGIFLSSATDMPRGFDEGHLAQVEALLPFLALSVKSRSLLEVARTLLETYLGPDAGRRVLTGEIDRHSVQKTQAVIWFCDLRGFSRVVSQVPPDELLEILSAYLEVMARPVLDNRGQILKFMGDGFLATFDMADRSVQAACFDAVTAAEQLLETLAPFNAERNAVGKSTLDLGIALHLGEVLYGNIGTKERLDFTVVGPAVNEASRIEGMCKPLGRQILISSAFRQAAAIGGDALVSAGVHTLRDIRGPLELFTIANA